MYELPAQRSIDTDKDTDTMNLLSEHKKNRNEITAICLIYLAFCLKHGLDLDGCWASFNLSSEKVLSLLYTSQDDWSLFPSVSYDVFARCTSWPRTRASRW